MPTCPALSHRHRYGIRSRPCPPTRSAIHHPLPRSSPSLVLVALPPTSPTLAPRSMYRKLRPPHEDLLVQHLLVDTAATMVHPARNEFLTSQTIALFFAAFDGCH